MLELPPDPADYFRTVWDIVLQVPSGTVTTFGQIASMIPAPTGVDEDEYERAGPRWVGKAMNAARIEDDIPWQRVINSQRQIALPAGSQGGMIQRDRLEGEGVIFDSRDRVDFEQVGWEGPDADWLEERGLKPPKLLRKKPGDQPPDEAAQQLTLF
jgi:methylated-DNA-protein-cysteine methyltransferase-like protein